MKPEGRILAIDYGSRRIGLALSDPLGITAQGLETLEVNSAEEALERLEDLASTYEVSRVVVGIPINMDGSYGEKAEEVAGFARALEKGTGLPVALWDERLTSVAAMRTMHEMGVRTKGRKKDLDRIAATILLQGYLSRMGRNSECDR